MTRGRSIQAPRVLVYVMPCRLSVDAAVKLGAFAEEQFGEGTTIQGSAEDGWDTAERPVWEVDGIVWAESAPRAWKWWRLDELHAFQAWARAHGLDARVPLFVQQWMSRKYSDYRAGGQPRVLLEDGSLVPPLPEKEEHDA